MSESKKRVTIKDPLIREKLNLKPNADFRYRLKGKKLKRYFEIISESQSEKVENTTVPNDYKSEPFVLSAWNKVTGKLMSIDEYCECYNMPREDVSSWKFLPHHYKEPTYHIVFKPRFEEVEEKQFDFDKIFKNKIKPVQVPLNLKEDLEGLFDRAVYSDAHLNMNPNPDGYSLYGGRWNEEDIDSRNEKFIKHIITDQTSRVLYLDDLGDFMDGLDKQTTRGGHELPQIMSDEDAYDLGLSFKIKQIDSLILHYDKIYVRNICNDNHAGKFSYFVNSAFKKYIELKYPERVEVFNQRKFIDHYIIECDGPYNYGFITSHGKDSKEKKFGMNPKLTDKDQRVIDDYIDEHYLCQKGLILQFDKGDSHQRIFDNTSSSRFSYHSYFAFSPSSNYIQTNFKKGKSGFDFFNYRKGYKMPVNIPDEFEWHVSKTNQVA